MIQRQVERLAERLLERARDEDDTKAAAILRRLGRVHDVAFEMVRSKTAVARQACYAELEDLLRGKAE